MRLVPSARLQKYLGRELIADPNLAVLEFVKNSYDAGASEVRVNFHLSDGSDRLVIADDGVGMDEAGFRANWLRPGFSEKSPDFRGKSATPVGRSPAAQRAQQREPAGEKGLGRLSAGRLGSRMQVWTRRSANRPWLHVDFDWDRFDDMTQAMDQISIPFDYETPPPSESFATGTAVEIDGLTQKWTGRMPGRPIPGRPRTRLGRLRQDLQFLLRPMEEDAGPFLVMLESDAAEPQDVGPITPATASEDTAEYKYEFSVSVDSQGYVQVSRTIERSDDLGEETGQPTFEVLDEGYVVTPETAKADQRPQKLDCGPFSGVFLYTPPPVARRAHEISQSGVLLYRDGILVEPYGLGDDDWLGVEARKASRQGHAPIQPHSFSGHVQIDRASNPQLNDMSNRLGLLEDEASEQFVEHVRAEFRRFEALVYEELTQHRWNKPTPARARSAANRTEFAQLKLRALVHRAGQPIARLGFSVEDLRSAAAAPDLPESARRGLEEIIERIVRQLDALQHVIDKVSIQSDLSESQVDLALLVDEAIHDVNQSTSLDTIGISVSGVQTMDRILVPRDLLFEAVVEYLTNAVESGADQVWVSATQGSASVALLIEDDGRGFAVPNDGGFAAVGGSKGRPATGLVGAAILVEACRGQVRVLSKPGHGTTVQILLPTSRALVDWSD